VNKFLGVVVKIILAPLTLLILVFDAFPSLLGLGRQWENKYSLDKPRLRERKRREMFAGSSVFQTSRKEPPKSPVHPGLLTEPPKSPVHPGPLTEPPKPREYLRQLSSFSSPTVPPKLPIVLPYQKHIPEYWRLIMNAFPPGTFITLKDSLRQRHKP
jgi:hypothetical protein